MASDELYRTDRHGLKHPLSVASEAPSYPTKANSCANGRGNSFKFLPHRSRSTGIPQGSVVYSVHQPIDEAVEDSRPPTYPYNMIAAVS